MGLSDIINRIKSALGMGSSGGRRQRGHQQSRGGQGRQQQGQHQQPQGVQRRQQQTHEGRGHHQQQAPPPQGQGHQPQGHQPQGHQPQGHQPQSPPQQGQGQQGSPQNTRHDGEGVDVTVEREPDTASEDAVKGTDTSTESGPVTESIAAEELQNGTGETDAEDATSDADDRVAEEQSAETGGTDESVDVLKGIGPTYADRLNAAGIETVADLAAADAEEVLKQADVPKGRLENWIERARHR